MKRLAIILGLAALAVVLFLAAAPRLLNSDMFMRRLDSALESALGASVRIDGGLRLSLLPYPGIEISNVVVESAPGFDGEPAARLSRMVVRVDLLPLLSREVQVREVRAEGVSVSLVRNEAGEWNVSQPSAPSDETTDDGEAARWSFVVERLNLSGLRAQVDDRLTGRFARLHNGSLVIGEGHDKHFTATASADMEMGPSGRMKALDGRLEWHGTGRRGPAREIVIEESALSVAFEALLPHGQRADFTLAASFSLDMATGRLDLESLTAEGAGASLSASAVVTDIFASPASAGAVALDLFEPAALYSLIGAEPPRSKDAAHLGFDFTASTDGLSLANLALRSGATEGGGEITVSRFAPPAVTARFSFTRLNIDDLPLPGPADESKNEPVAPASDTPAESVLRGLIHAAKGLDMDLTLDVARLEAAPVVMRDLAVNVSTHDGVLSAKRFDALLANGRFRGDIRAKLSEEEIFADLRLGAASISQQSGGNGNRGVNAATRANETSALPGEQPVATLAVEARGSLAAWTLTIAIPEFSPRRLAAVADVTLPQGLPASSLASASLHLACAGDEQGFKVREGRVVLDGSTARLSARIDDLRKVPAEISLAVDRLDLDRYRPLLRAAPDAQAADLDEPLALARFHDLATQAEIKAEWLRYEGVVIRNLDLRLRAANGAKRSELNALAFGGRVQATSLLATGGQRPRIEATATLAGLDAALVLGVGGRRAPAKGRLDGNLTVSGEGDTRAEILNALRASSEVRLSQGALLPHDGKERPLALLAATFDISPEAGLHGEGASGFAYGLKAKLTAREHGEGPRGQTELSGSLVIPQSLDGFRLLGGRFGLDGSWPAFKGPDKAFAATGRLDYDSRKDSIALSDISGRALGIPISGFATMTGQGADVSWRGRLDVAPFTPRTVIEGLQGKPRPTRDPSVLAAARLGFDFAHGQNTLVLTNLDLRLDQTTLAGSVTLKSLDPLNIAFDLTGSELHVDRYRAPRGPDEQDDGSGPVELPIEFLSGISAQGRLALDAFSIYGIPGRNIRLQLSGEDGDILVKPFSAVVCEGPLEAVVRNRVSGGMMALDIDFTGRNFNLGELLVSMADAPYAGGVTTLAGHISFLGATNDELLENMNGKVRLDSRNGWLLFTKPRGDKVETSITELIPDPATAKALAQARGTVRPEAATAFATAGADIVVEDGVVGTAEVLLDQPWTYKAVGKGGTDLVREEVDYRVTITALGLATIPVAIRGPWEDVKVEVNTGAAILDTATGLIKDAVTLPFRILDAIIP